MEKIIMNENYYEKEDLKKFPSIGKYSKKLANKYFDYYGEVFSDGHLGEKEKSLIALAVAHAIQCPYCIDAYTTSSLSKGATSEQMMEAVHVAAAIRSGASLVHGVQMMNNIEKISI